MMYGATVKKAGYAGVLLGAMVFLLGCQTSAKLASATPTNFIQILTDDQGWGDLGSYGHQFIETPNIDGLAADGWKFTHCYSADSVCSPSRASVLTGRTPYRTGVFRWIPQSHYSFLPATERTLPQILRENGYQTAHFGKWHLSHYQEVDLGNGIDYKDFAFGGNPKQPSMKEYGYDYWFATGNVARPDHKDPLNFFLNGTAMGKMEGYSAQIVAKEFVKWMNEHRKKNQPFFITLWFHEPHGPVESAPEFTKLYDKLDDPSMREYLANVTQIDDAVGTVMQALEQAGISDDTLVWYTSDNGPEGPHEFGSFNKSDSAQDPSRYRGDTGGLRGRKRATHEGGIRVPGIIRWPAGMKRAGIKPGIVSDEPIIASDIFPTFLHIAGVDVPENVTIDGTSIVPLLENRKMVRERPLYWRNNYYKYRVAIREGDWKLLSNSQRTEFSLHNLIKDPRETTDLSSHEPERLARMKKSLIEYDKEVLADGPTWWEKDNRIAPYMPTDAVRKK